MKGTILAALFSTAFTVHANLPTESAENYAALSQGVPPSSDIVAEVVDQEVSANTVLDESGWDGVVEKVSLDETGVQLAYEGDLYSGFFGTEVTTPTPRGRHSARVPRGGGTEVSYGGGGNCGGGVASYYGSELRGHRTASGERFNPGAYTAAHRTLPLGTVVRVTNHRTGLAVSVRINDRGPFVRGRVIDLSAGAARAIGMGGTTQVSLSCGG